MKTNTLLGKIKINTRAAVVFILIAMPVASLASRKADTTIAREMRLQLDAWKGQEVLMFPNSVERFYRQKTYQPVWIINQQQAWQGVLLLNCVLQFGLCHADYHPKELEYSGLRKILEHPESVSRNERVRYEIMITDALITLMNHLHYGKLNPFFSTFAIDKGYAGEFCAPDLLADAVGQDDMLTRIVSVQPKGKSYTDLQNKMREITQYQEDCNNTPEASVRKMAINLERLRWADIINGNWVQVNIPSFDLRFHLKDTSLLFKVAVGPKSEQTPILNSVITDFTTASVLAGKGKEVKNPKGVIYFWFKNPYGTCLAGRPEKDIFKANNFTTTNDGILVDQPEKLASTLLEQDNNIPDIKLLEQSIADYAMVNFVLQKPVPIKITYLTCEVRFGHIICYPDIYEKDKQLETKLYNTGQLPQDKLVSYAQ